ncbi:MAG: ComEC/Rec2 family competence protein [Flavitalea sp.]
MALPVIPVWKEAPFVRILFPFVTGIIIQNNFPFSFIPIILILLISLTIITLFAFTNLSFKFKYNWINGVSIHALLFGWGCFLTIENDLSPQAKAADNYFSKNTITLVTLREPLSGKPSSWKTIGEIKGLQYDTTFSSPINIIIYFRKDSFPIQLKYGDRIAFSKPPQRIKNFSSAGDFNYVKYCALRNIYFQIYLGKDDYTIVKGNDASFPGKLLLSIRDWVISVLQKNIPSKKEYGFAEALLIGYKDDLEKGLLSSYSNTGVVHVVAISGLHLGLIYGLLKYICIPFGKKSFAKWLTPLIVLSGLWVFSLLAGGGPSVLRSAVMFSSIVLGENIQRRASIINNLAASAFVLLCYDPFWFWDIGFQLSYSALLSIVIFQKAIYHLLPFKNKLGDRLWKLNAVTVSAQLLTVPVSLFYFHQFPNLFLITNFIAVPLSSIVLMGEIGLCVISFISILSKPFGIMVCWLIKLLNGTIEWMDSFKYSTITGIHIDLFQLVLLYVVIFTAGAWLILKKNKYVKVLLVAVILFMADQFI